MKNVWKNCVLFCVQISLLPRRFVLVLILGYQKTLSLDHGIFKHKYPHGYCQFMPTCSQYGYEAVKRYGVIRGGLRAFWRVLRCNPCSRGGYDPVVRSGKET